jgi:hypothetical protein
MEELMSVRKSRNGRWRIGNGKAIYGSRAMAMQAWRAYLYSRSKGPVPQ